MDSYQEFYMDCAVVNIVNPNNTDLSKPLVGFPDMSKANLVVMRGGIVEFCRTQPDCIPMYANPGKSITIGKEAITNSSRLCLPTGRNCPAAVQESTTLITSTKTENQISTPTTALFVTKTNTPTSKSNGASTSKTKTNSTTKQAPQLTVESGYVQGDVYYTTIHTHTEVRYHTETFTDTVHELVETQTLPVTYYPEFKEVITIRATFQAPAPTVETKIVTITVLATPTVTAPVITVNGTIKSSTTSSR